MNQIGVLKGPRHIFGKSATAGVISNDDDPSDEFEFEFEQVLKPNMREPLPI